MLVEATGTGTAGGAAGQDLAVAQVLHVPRASGRSLACVGVVPGGKGGKAVDGARWVVGGEGECAEPVARGASGGKGWHGAGVFVWDGETGRCVAELGREWGHTGTVSAAQFAKGWGPAGAHPFVVSLGPGAVDRAGGVSSDAEHVFVWDWHRSPHVPLVCQPVREGDWRGRGTGLCVLDVPEGLHAHPWLRGRLAAGGFSRSGPVFVTHGAEGHLRAWITGVRGDGSAMVESFDLHAEPSPDALRRSRARPGITVGREVAFVGVARVAAGAPDVGSSPLPGVHALTQCGKLCTVRLRGGKGKGLGMQGRVDTWVSLKVGRAYVLGASHSLVAAACERGIVRLFRPHTLQFLTTLRADRVRELGSAPGEGDDIMVVAVSARGEDDEIVAVSRNGEGRSWRVSAGRNRAKMGAQRKVSERVEDALALVGDWAVPKGEETAVTLDADGGARLWTYPVGKNFSPLPACSVSFDSPATCVGSCVAGRGVVCVAAGCEDGSVGVRHVTLSDEGWKVDIGCVWDAHGGGCVHSISVSEDGQFVASAGGDGMLVFRCRKEDRGENLIAYDPWCVLEIANHLLGPVSRLRISRGDGAGVTAVTAGPSGRCVVITLQDSSNGKVACKMHVNQFGGEDADFEVAALDVCPATRSVVVAAGVDRSTGRPVCASWSLLPVAVVGDSRCYCSEGDDGACLKYRPGIRHTGVGISKNWRPVGGEWPVYEWSELGASVQGLALDPSGQFVALAGPGPIVTIADVRSGSPVVRMRSHGAASVTSVAFLADCERLASWGDDGSHFVWNLGSTLANAMKKRLAGLYAQGVLLGGHLRSFALPGNVAGAKHGDVPKTPVSSEGAHAAELFISTPAVEQFGVPDCSPFAASHSEVTPERPSAGRGYDFGGVDGPATGQEVPLAGDVEFCVECLAVKEWDVQAIHGVGGDGTRGLSRVGEDEESEDAISLAPSPAPSIVSSCTGTSMAALGSMLQATPSTGDFTIFRVPHTPASSETLLSTEIHGVGTFRGPGLSVFCDEQTPSTADSNCGVETSRPLSLSRFAADSGAPSLVTSGAEERPVVGENAISTELKQRQAKIAGDMEAMRARLERLGVLTPIVAEKGAPPPLPPLGERGQIRRDAPV